MKAIPGISQIGALIIVVALALASIAAVPAGQVSGDFDGADAAHDESDGLCAQPGSTPALPEIETECDSEEPVVAHTGDGDIDDELEEESPDGTPQDTEANEGTLEESECCEDDEPTDGEESEENDGADSDIVISPDDDSAPPEVETPGGGTSPEPNPTPEPALPAPVDEGTPAAPETPAGEPAPAPAPAPVVPAPSGDTPSQPDPAPVPTLPAPVGTSEPQPVPPSNDAPTAATTNFTQATNTAPHGEPAAAGTVAQPGDQLTTAGGPASREESSQGGDAASAPPTPATDTLASAAMTERRVVPTPVPRDSLGLGDARPEAGPDAATDTNGPFGRTEISAGVLALIALLLAVAFWVLVEFGAGEIQPVTAGPMEESRMQKRATKAGSVGAAAIPLLKSTNGNGHGHAHAGQNGNGQSATQRHRLLPIARPVTGKEHIRGAGTAAAPGAIAPGPVVLFATFDDPGASRIANDLGDAGFTVVELSSDEELIGRFEDVKPDLVLMAVSAPRMEGLAATEELRRVNSVPVILVLDRRTGAEAVHGLQLGADDCLVRPVSIAEISARIRAVIRRSKASEEEHHVIRAGDLEIDLEYRTVKRAGKRIELTPTEWQVLRCLALNAGRVVLKEELLITVWGREYQDASNYLRVWIPRLRRRLFAGEGEEAIRTIHGRGYVLDIDDANADVSL